MEMMNRAIEDASDFMEMKRRMVERAETAIRAELFERKLVEAVQKVHPPKRHGENRAQYRARVYGKAAA